MSKKQITIDTLTAENEGLRAKVALLQSEKETLKAEHAQEIVDIRTTHAADVQAERERVSQWVDVSVIQSVNFLLSRFGRGLKANVQPFIEEGAIRTKSDIGLERLPAGEHTLLNQSTASPE